MYKIERRSSGYILTFSGQIEASEMQKWCDESEKTLANEANTSFGVIIDMKNMQPLSTEANKILITGQKLYKQRGMKRSAVILNNPEVCKHLKNVAVQSGIYVTERYIDASIHGDASTLAINWVKDGIDPDKL